MINNDTDDENEIVEWINKPLQVTFALFDCGCCEDCICDVNISCVNCKCSCQVSYNNKSIDTDSDSDEAKNKDIVEYSINDFTIDIIEDKDKERKVRVNVNIDFGNLHKNIIIKLDINKTLYLQIAEDLFNL
jgi:hypothetical protein